MTEREKRLCRYCKVPYVKGAGLSRHERVCQSMNRRMELRVPPGHGMDFVRATVAELNRQTDELNDFLRREALAHRETLEFFRQLQLEREGHVIDAPWRGPRRKPFTTGVLKCAS